MIDILVETFEFAIEKERHTGRTTKMLAALENYVNHLTITHPATIIVISNTIRTARTLKHIFALQIIGKYKNITENSDAIVINDKMWINFIPEKDTVLFTHVLTKRFVDHFVNEEIIREGLSSIRNKLKHIKG